MLFARKKCKALTPLVWYSHLVCRRQMRPYAYSSCNGAGVSNLPLPSFIASSFKAALQDLSAALTNPCNPQGGSLILGLIRQPNHYHCWPINSFMKRNILLLTYAGHITWKFSVHACHSWIVRGDDRIVWGILLYISPLLLP